MRADAPTLFVWEAVLFYVDPDAVKYLLPEMQGYIRRDQARAGSLTHHESGFIAEIITQAALLRGGGLASALSPACMVLYMYSNCCR